MSNAALANAALVPELEKLENIFEMGGNSTTTKKSKSLWPASSLCCCAGLDAALVKAQLLFAGAPPIEDKIDQTIQTLRWRLAKVAFDTVQVFAAESMIFG